MKILFLYIKEPVHYKLPLRSNQPSNPSSGTGMFTAALSAM
jgi:hypothetical protein